MSLLKTSSYVQYLDQLQILKDESIEPVVNSWLW